MRYRNGAKSRIARDLELDSYLDHALESYLLEEGREFTGRIRRDRSNMLDLDSYIDDVLESYLLEEGEDSDYAQGDVPNRSSDEMAAQIYAVMANNPSYQNLAERVQDIRLFVAFLVGSGRGVQAEKPTGTRQAKKPDLSFISPTDFKRVNLEVDYDYEPITSRGRRKPVTETSQRWTKGIYKHAVDHLKIMCEAFENRSLRDRVAQTRSVFVAIEKTQEGLIKEVRHVSYEFKVTCQPSCRQGCIEPTPKIHVRFERGLTASQAVTLGVLDNARNAQTASGAEVVEESLEDKLRRRLKRKCLFSCGL